MTYLFAAYTIIFVLITGYAFLLGKRQRKVVKDIEFLKSMQNDKS